MARAIILVIGSLLIFNIDFRVIKTVYWTDLSWFCHDRSNLMTSNL